ncbi:MAG: ANTAR domain-containing protein [Bryobacteraceae bacterium]|jgi:GAF domain-containing protein
MAAFALQNIAQARYYVRLDSAKAEAETDQALLLDTVRPRTGSQAAVLYQMQPEMSAINAIAARSTVQSRVKEVGVTLSPATSEWIESLRHPVQGSHAGEPNFEKFPEVLQYQLKRLMVVPLRTDDGLLGLLTLGRSAETSFEPKAIDAAQRAGRLLTALFERDSLRQKLLERKLMERAKGILQERRAISEEEAYLLLRNNSRRRRLPMAELAREIIETRVQAGTTRRWQTA